eukprot:172458-Alexandrium_andersonii.AAC.1
MPRTSTRSLVPTHSTRRACNGGATPADTTRLARCASSCRRNCRLTRSRPLPRAARRARRRAARDRGAASRGRGLGLPLRRRPPARRA